MHNRPLATAACAIALAGTMVGAAAQEASAIEAVERYCATSWRQARISPQDWDDCTQQVLVDLLQRVDRDGIPRAMSEAASAERRELKRAVWAAAQRWRRRRCGAALQEHDAVHCDRREDVGAELRELVGESARLTPRQRDILQQSLDGAAAYEIAEELGISAARVSDEKYKAIRKLRAECAAPENGLA